MVSVRWVAWYFKVCLCVSECINGTGAYCGLYSMLPFTRFLPLSLYFSILSFFMFHLTFRMHCQLVEQHYRIEDRRMYANRAIVIVACCLWETQVYFFGKAFGARNTRTKNQICTDDSHFLLVFWREEMSQKTIYLVYTWRVISTGSPELRMYECVCVGVCVLYSFSVLALASLLLPVYQSYRSTVSMYNFSEIKSQFMTNRLLKGNNKEHLLDKSATAKWAPVKIFSEIMDVFVEFVCILVRL